MQGKIQNIIIAVLAIGLGISFYLHSGKPKTNDNKIGYVKTQDLVYGYQGMKDATAKFEQEKAEWVRNVDTLKLDYQRSVQAYNENKSVLTPEQITEREQLLQHQYNNLLQYNQRMETTLEEREAVILEGVLNQINSYAQDYAKKNGFNLVLTTTASGNIMYADEAMDLTEILLKELNNNYNGN